MKKVEYSQLVKRKLLELKKELTGEYGEEKTKEILTAMADHVDGLGLHEESGVSISRMYDIDTDYWYLFTNHNYFIYRIETKKVIIVQMFNEREDFMMKLFGISGRTQESIDYWGE
ncbi:MAG: hypothetical protein KBG42_04850 [Lachnospiraceae bacterium]|nr:hypothetical protein [Lachnospiraceae bacterium]